MSRTAPPHDRGRRRGLEVCAVCGTRLPLTIFRDGFPAASRTCLNRVCLCRPELTGAPLLLLCKSSLFLTGLGSQPRRRNFWRCTPRQTAASSALNTPPQTPLRFERIARCASDGRVQTVAFASRRCTPKLPQAFTDAPRTPGGSAPSCHSPVL